MIYALGGNDEIHAPIGNNFVDGGEGIDTLVIYQGVRADYQLIANADGTVTIIGPGLNTANVVYQLNDVEQVAFNDGVFAIADIDPGDPPPVDPPPVDPPPTNNPPATLNGQTIYYRDGHLYMLTSAQQSWTSAQAEAEQYGGNDLASGS